MNKTEINKEFTVAMRGFSAAYSALKVAIDRYEQMTGTSVNDLKHFVDNYPFDKSFDELDIGLWAASVIGDLEQLNFKVLDYEYLNTGGNCMVGIHKVWLPDEKKVVYVYTNEEGATISTVDYIRDELELDVDDYNMVIVDDADWGRITGHEKYFELYRHCYNQYLVDDCKYFGITRGVQYHLLSDELQKKVDADYLAWLESESNGLVDTDGKKIIVQPDYEPAADEDVELTIIKDFKQWHDTLPGDDTLEKMYDHDYLITLTGRSVRIPFDANAFSIIDELLAETIKEW